MTKEKLRIMYASNAPWCASGYGIQGRSLLPRLQQLDVVDELAVFAWFGLQGGGTMANGLPSLSGWARPLRQRYVRRALRPFSRRHPDNADRCLGHQAARR